MTRTFRVVNLTTPEPDPVEYLVNAVSPEVAATKALGIEVVRSGAPKDLVARVYWQLADHPPNMVRLYRKVDSFRAPGRG